MKVMYGKDAQPYTPTGHYDVKCLRLHDQTTSGSAHLVMGASYFLPKGGAADFATVPEGVTLIYYIVYGEMTITTDQGEYVLQAGDSVCFNENDGRSCKNTGDTPALMLVVMGR